MHNWRVKFQLDSLLHHIFHGIRWIRFNGISHGMAMGEHNPTVPLSIVSR
jgi:hypothetical protein